MNSPSSPTDRFQYGYDRDGNVLYKNNLVRSSFSELYHANSATSGDDNSAYDNLNRLTGFRRGTLSSSGHNGTGLDTVTTLNTNANSSQSWTLDAVGNQTAVNTDGTNKTNTVNSQNELTGFGTATLGFDSNGNTTTDDQGHTLVYDAWNRLVAVKNGGTTLASYAYDATGNRVTQTDNGTTSELYNSALGQVLEERQTGTTTNQYVWSLAYVNAPVVRDDNSTSGSYGQTGSGLGRRIYVQEDANFNVTSLTNTSGTVQQRFVYTPYGVMTVLDGTTAWGSTTNLLSWVYTFQGGRYDAAKGMVQFGEREYSPVLARWAQQDPLGADATSSIETVARFEAGASAQAKLIAKVGTRAAGQSLLLRTATGANPYMFVNEHPVEVMDPSGMDAISPFRWFYHFVPTPIPATPPAKPTVYVCQRPAHLPLGDVASLLGMKHRWLVVVFPDGTRVTGGLGNAGGIPDANGSPVDVPYYAGTYVTGHDSESTYDATVYPDVDGDQAANILRHEMNSYHGTWKLGFNDCNTYCDEVIQGTGPKPPFRNPRVFKLP